MNTTWSRFNMVSVAAGFAFLYLPILILIIFFVQDSEPKENQYGPNPKFA